MATDVCEVCGSTNVKEIKCQGGLSELWDDSKDVL